jgi:hypothetical protein
MSVYFVLAVLFVWACVSTFFMFKFVRIILSLEDVYSDVLGDYDETIDALVVVDESLDKIINMPIFFDNPEIRGVIDKAKTDTTVSRLIIRKLTEKFIKKTKEKNLLVKAAETVAFQEHDIIDNATSNLFETQNGLMSPEDIDFIRSVETINSVINKKTPNNTVFGRSS